MMYSALKAITVVLPEPGPKQSAARCGNGYSMSMSTYLPCLAYRVQALQQDQFLTLITNDEIGRDNGFTHVCLRNIIYSAMGFSGCMQIEEIYACCREGRGLSTAWRCTCIDQQRTVDVCHNCVVLQRVICGPSKLEQVLHMPAQPLLHQLSLQACRHRGAESTGHYSI